MINQIILIGKIKEIETKECKKELLLEVERPYRENEGKVFDVFTCKLWGCIFDKIVSLCNIGDTIAIKGRVNVEDSKYIVNGENVVLLNKSKNNISKNEEI